MLKFDCNRQFKVLVVADVQAYRPLNTTKQGHLQALINKCVPDLVVLLGDMLLGLGMLTHRRARRVIASIVEPIDRLRIPFVFIGGNHDLEACMSLEKQIDMYRLSAHCLTPPVSRRERKDLYHLDIVDEDHQAAVRLLFIDSGVTRLTLRGLCYMPAPLKQVQYVQKLLSSPSCPPAYIFQHIPIPEIYRLLREVDSSVQDAVPGRGPYRGRYLKLTDDSSGVLGEAPCSPWENTGQYDAWVHSGKVRGAVFGHDHKNSFVGKLNNISLIQTSCAGLSCYGRNDLRGGRLLTISSDGSFETQELFYCDFVKQNRS